jgi:hypothetical protein
VSDLLLLFRRAVAGGGGSLPGDLVITVGNTDAATEDLVIGIVEVDPEPDEGGQFTIVSDTATAQVLAPGDQRTVVVRFTPTIAGTHTATLRVPSSDPDGAVEIPLSGTALASEVFIPGITVDPPSWAAGDVLTTSGSAATTVTVASSGTGDLTVGTLVVAGSGFAKVDDEASGQVIPAGEARTVGLTFDPSSNGAKTGSLTVPSDGGASVVVALTGTGVATPPDPPAATVEVSRFYLGRQPAPSGITVPNANWGRHTIDADNALTTTKGGAPSAYGTTTNLTIGQTTRLGRWIGPPMAAQDLVSTFTAYCSGAYRTSALGEHVTSALRFGIWRAATDTIEQQGIKAHSASVEPWRTSDEPLPRRMPSGPPDEWDIDITFAEGDRLIIEAGARGTGATSTTAGIRMRWGGTSTSPDVSTGLELQLTYASWIEFVVPLLVLT